MKENHSTIIEIERSLKNLEDELFYGAEHLYPIDSTDLYVYLSEICDILKLMLELIKGGDNL
ncbi:MAG: hypothetical protein ACTSQS_18315 [Promethearchaeota archaeon]